MDITVKEYEHRHLTMSVCEHKCNVSGKYVLPQAQAFGLSWSMATAGLADIRSCNWGRTEMQRLWPDELQHGGILLRPSLVLVFASSLVMIYLLFS